MCKQYGNMDSRDDTREAQTHQSPAKDEGRRNERLDWTGLGWVVNSKNGNEL